jgi:hypothetical protein
LVSFIINKRCFIKNNNAISEEFTSLPALSIIIIGLVIFSTLIGFTYKNYEMQTNNLGLYDYNEYIISKIINVNNDFIKSGGIIDIPKFLSQSGYEKIKDIQNSLNQINFTFKISYENNSFWYPSKPVNVNQNTAMLRNIALNYNGFETIPGQLMVVVWREGI